MLSVSLIVCLLAALAIRPVIAADDAATAKRLVAKVQGKHNHPEYYTGKHSFMLDEDSGPLKKGLYLMSWLVLDPPIVLAAGGGAASIGKDLYNQYLGIKEDEATAKPANWPIAGQKAQNPSEGIGKDGMWWIPINFQDLVDAKQGALFASGNEFDWAEWGGQGLNQFHEYLFCLVKWNKDTKVTFMAGSDDPEQTWVNGKKVMEGLADRDWAPDTEKADVNVKGDEWVAILGEVGENGGEAAYTLRVEPAPDDHTLDVEGVLAVDAIGKLTTTWGHIKTNR
jgi:hypothetical protein